MRHGKPNHIVSMYGRVGAQMTVKETQRIEDVIWTKQEKLGTAQDAAYILNMPKSTGTLRTSSLPLGHGVRSSILIILHYSSGFLFLPPPTTGTRYN